MSCVTTPLHPNKDEPPSATSESATIRTHFSACLGSLLWLLVYSTTLPGGLASVDASPLLIFRPQPYAHTLQSTSCRQDIVDSSKASITHTDLAAFQAART